MSSFIGQKTKFSVTGNGSFNKRPCVPHDFSTNSARCHWRKDSARGLERAPPILIRCRWAFSYSFSLDPYLYTCQTSCTKIPIVTELPRQCNKFLSSPDSRCHFLMLFPRPQISSSVSNFNRIGASSYSSLHTAEFVLFRLRNVPQSTTHTGRQCCLP
jgi:hypothetical protein